MNVPRSEVFDDVYFSAADGMAETHHVFLAANNLPENWQNKRDFTIAETGFGTGLNFLCAWKLFDKTAAENQTLHFISAEKYPLTPEQIKTYLSALITTSRENDKDEWLPYLETLCANYPIRVPGFHRIAIKPNITLTLMFDDANEAFPRLDAAVDCWFLDGFKPSTNPDMWSDTLFREMNRLSAPGATFATFTAAGAVKRGLQTAGFDVRKIPGFGTKRDMLAGTFTPPPTGERKEEGQKTE